MTAPSLELLCEGFLGPSKEKASHQKQVHISPGSLHPSQRLCHNAFFALFIRRRLPGYGIIEANTCVKLNILLYVVSVFARMGPSPASTACIVHHEHHGTARCSVPKIHLGQALHGSAL